MEFIIKEFSQLTIEELYQILQLRSEVFVVEQDCVYQDIDGKDPKALHIFGIKNNEIISYTRCFDKGIYFEEAVIGRVVVKIEQRKYGYGHKLMQVAIKSIKNRYNTGNIKISAQEYLKKFYESHGFRQIGEGYLEDGIPHIAMIREE